MLRKGRILKCRLSDRKSYFCKIEGRNIDEAGSFWVRWFGEFMQPCSIHFARLEQDPDKPGTGPGRAKWIGSWSNGGLLDEVQATCVFTEPESVEMLALLNEEVGEGM